MNKKPRFRKQFLYTILKFTGRVNQMLGLLLNSKETQEIEYVLKKEMEELLLDLTDPRIDDIVKTAMEEKYQIIFGIYRRFATPKEFSKYIRVQPKRKWDNQI